MISILFSFLQALYGELLGMFRDRLASEAHVQQFEAILKQTMRKYFGKEVRAVNPTKNRVYTEFCFQKIYFVPKSPKSQGQLHGLTHDEWLEEVQRQITICSELIRHYIELYVD